MTPFRLIFFSCQSTPRHNLEYPKSIKIVCFSIFHLEESTRTMINVQLDQNFLTPNILLPFLFFYTFVASLNYIDCQ